MRDLVAPRKGWRRGFTYIGRRVQRLPDTPHRIALGFACGAMASFTPFFTLHALIAVILALAVRGNLLAAAFGTIVGNPLSFPFIAAACIQMGNLITGRSLGEDAMEKFSFSYLGEHPWQFFEGIFTPYLIGGLIPGLVCSAAFYFVLRPMVARFQSRRRDTLAQRASDLVSARRRANRETGAAPADDNAEADLEPSSTAGGPRRGAAAGSGLSQRTVM